MPNIVFFFFILTLIIMGTLTITILVIVRISTTRALKKHGYHPNNSQIKYKQIEEDLYKIKEDLGEIQFQLYEIEPHLKDMEFLMYAKGNDKSKLGRLIRRG
ncbi:hypothetical protein JT359_04920 [Candidatus Poribacteria bacterium]|nr:hypothetical protein [Candidatus Poribacteria bacterium]